MDNDNVVALAAPALVSDPSDPLTDPLRTGARRLIEAAVAVEFEEHLATFGKERLADGRRRVVRNGHLPGRQVLTGIGAVDVRVPKSRSREGAPATFCSSEHAVDDLQDGHERGETPGAGCEASGSSPKVIEGMTFNDGIEVIEVSRTAA